MPNRTLTTFLLSKSRIVINKEIRGEVFIPMGVYHRLIKGKGDLKIKLKKLKMIFLI
jgi:hypothetical protein